MTWERLRTAVSRDAGELWPPQPAGAGCCAVCRGAAQPGYARCYQCGTHLDGAPGMLADVVVPISYAVKGEGHAVRLRLYKTDGPAAAAAGAALRALMLVFLHDHAPCIWRHAAMPPPTRLAVVPSGQGRPGAHPLLRLLSPSLALRPVTLAVRPGEHLGRELNPWRFRAESAVAGASVLLVDDTWVSGASAQSAAVALRAAGAGHVAVVVLGRHVDPDDPHSQRLCSAFRATAYDSGTCAVHTVTAVHSYHVA
jgi:hypothetical protein